MKFNLYNREFYENLEQKSLAPYATLSKDANNTRIHAEEEHPYRTSIQRDRDRIIHSRAFRRLKHKQQVFLISEGDHYRTRLTHTLEVSQLSRTLARALGLNELLTEAIALGHDLGHTPFGHVGEIVLNKILNGKDDLDGLLSGNDLGGFKHNYQSVRVVDFIEKKYSEYDGLNLTAYVREGILKHTRLLRAHYSYPDFEFDGLHFELDHATTLEGQVVAICDEIAQRTHDLEDGIRAGLVDISRVRKVEIIQHVEKMHHLDKYLPDAYGYRNRMIRELINFLIGDVIETTIDNIEKFYQRKKRLNFFDEEIVKFSSNVDPLQRELNHFIYQEIIFKCAGNDYRNDNKKMLRQIFKSFLLYPAMLPDYIVDRLRKMTSDEQLKLNDNILPNYEDKFVRAIADHVAGMTDSYAQSQARKMRAPDEN